MTSFTAPRAAGGFVLVLTLFVAGCSDEKPTGTVTGVANYKGKPLTLGDVNLLSSTGAAAITRIEADGRFTLATPIEAGEYRVYASPPEAEQAPPGTKVAAPRKFDLPAKFRDPNTSGVVVTVKPGSNELVIEFKD